MTIFLVFKNADSTEGRGPMLFHSAFKTLDLACEFLDTQCGIMGRKCPLERQYGSGRWTMNDHDIQEVCLYDSMDAFRSQQKANIREAALQKLTPEEMDVLGL